MEGRSRTLWGRAGGGAVLHLTQRGSLGKSAGADVDPLTPRNPSVLQKYNFSRSKACSVNAESQRSRYSLLLPQNIPPIPTESSVQIRR